MIHPPFSALLAHPIAPRPHDLVEFVGDALPLLVLGTLDGKVIQNLVLMLGPGLLCELLARVHEVPFIQTLGLCSARHHVGDLLPVVVREGVDSLCFRPAVLYYGES